MDFAPSRCVCRFELICEIFDLSIPKYSRLDELIIFVRVRPIAEMLSNHVQFPLSPELTRGRGRVWYSAINDAGHFKPVVC